MLVDSDHAGDKQRQRSTSGFIIFLNMAPVVWFSKKQATIKTSVFGAEFVAMKQGMECVRGLYYKLRMMGVAISGPSYVYGDNMSVIHNTKRPEAVLQKKSNAICHHAIREGVAMGECLTGHMSTHDNPADICTKIIREGKNMTIWLVYSSTTLPTTLDDPPHRGLRVITGSPDVPRCTSKYQFMLDCDDIMYQICSINLRGLIRSTRRHPHRPM
jgi:hypothetical protein